MNALADTHMEAETALDHAQSTLDALPRPGNVWNEQERANATAKARARATVVRARETLEAVATLAAPRPTRVIPPALARTDSNNRGVVKTVHVDLTEHVDLDETFSPFLRGLAKQNRGDLEGAIDDFSEAIRIDPDKTLPYYNRGLAKAELGDLEGAIDDFSEAIRTDPFAAFLYRARALTLKEIRQCEAAIADARRAGIIRLDEKTNVAERFDCAPEVEQDGQD